jgi:hypothetical protein
MPLRALTVLDGCEDGFHTACAWRVRAISTTAADLVWLDFWRGGFSRGAAKPAGDRFGDAWYCVGAGSKYTQRDAQGSSPKRVELGLRNLTRLPSCSGHLGSTRVSANIKGGLGRTTVTSSDAALAGTAFTSFDRSCGGTACQFSFDDAAAMRHGLLDVQVASAFSGTFGAGPESRSIASATWFATADATSNGVGMRCASTGMVEYDPSNGAQVELTDAGPFVSCPGQAVTEDSLDFVLKL